VAVVVLRVILEELVDLVAEVLDLLDLPQGEQQHLQQVLVVVVEAQITSVLVAMELQVSL